MQSRRWIVVAALSFVVILTGNVWRYASWYPYGHFDGAQYGNEYVGWNRAGLVSFEILPALDATLARLRPQPGAVIPINARFSSVPLYNDWIRRMLENRYASTYPQLRFISEPVGPESHAALVLTSPPYNPALEERLPRLGYSRLAILGIKGIDIVTIWARGKRVQPDR
jgi:hypothetical protein